MNFYKRHLGDYAKDTGHLSMLEHGAYGLLLDRYYGTESPIPDAEKYRVTRARSKDEKDAVDVVLGEFFRLQDGVWHHKRCDEEIGKASHQREVNRELGLRGGRPRKTESVPSSITESVSDQRTESVSRLEPIDNPSQTPDTRHQTKPRAERGGRIPAGWRPSDAALSWAASDRPDVDTDTATEAFVDHFTAKTGADATALDWDARWRNWIRREKATPKVNGKPAAPQFDDWWRSDQGIERKGRELGMFARGGESYPSFRERISERLREVSHA